MYAMSLSMLVNKIQKKRTIVLDDPAVYWGKVLDLKPFTVD